MKKIFGLRAGFSLMEMMVVLLIISIVAAVTAPMVSKKLARNAELSGSPWVFPNLGNDIAYNLRGKNITALIGAASVPRDPLGVAQHPKLYIQSSTDEPQITFGTKDSEETRKTISLLVDPSDYDTDKQTGGRIGLTDAKDIRAGTVAFGFNQDTNKKQGGVLVGYNNTITGLNGISIGSHTTANKKAIAIGAHGGVKYSVRVSYHYEYHRPDGTFMYRLPTNYSITYPPTFVADEKEYSSKTEEKYKNQAVDFITGMPLSASPYTIETRVIDKVEVSHSDVTETKALDIECIAIGSNSNSSYASSIAIGSNTVAKGDPLEGTESGHAMAIGSSAQATALAATAIGREARATDSGSTALGERTYAAAWRDLAIGYNASADTTGAAITWTESPRSDGTIPRSAIAIGEFSKATGLRSIAIGTDSRAPYKFCTALGPGANAHGETHDYRATTAALKERASGWATAVGNSAKATGVASTALGVGAEARGDGSIAIGEHPTAVSWRDYAIGYRAWVDTTESHNSDPGYTGRYYDSYIRTELNNRGLNMKIDSDTPGDNSVGLPQGAVAIGEWAKATGCRSVAIGTGAHVEERDTIVLGGAHNQRIDLNANGNINLNATNGNINLNAKKIFQRGAHLHTYSDRRLKNVGKKFTGGLAELKKLDIYNYTFKDDKEKTPRVGIMAQDLQKVFPDAVTKGDKGFLAIRQEDMFYAIINAVKELDAKITAIEEKIKAYVDIVKKLEQKIKAQEATIAQQQKEIKELKKQNAKFTKQNADFDKRLRKLEAKN